MLTINRLNLTEAKLIIEGAMQKAAKIGVPMCISVVDESGSLIAFERMDGGKIHSITLSQDKAFTAASARKATHEVNQVCIPGDKSGLFGIHTALGGRMCIVGGGLPISYDGMVIGGIGVSSGSPKQDLDCAQAGVDIFNRITSPTLSQNIL
ncbi:heme-binding protein [Shewanella sp. D64]|uniref:GlcG/HbpS family heme-binding protein n=1 Tax=unclassified Shewanella TaxID=196818 RepID=UPI0022BA25F0|nr:MULTISPECIES: heme-binding protein [unclassified Shewanella]MEC4725209.1 heme-binding protein [Shewanella sp. D64]MEC4735945.1 heme-binding protein [Shewanella sp. E94]WBJ93089.1 heme-binding protein [Shewanella sp. MTB7]